MYIYICVCVCVCIHLKKPLFNVICEYANGNGHFIYSIARSSIRIPIRNCIRVRIVNSRLKSKVRTTFHVCICKCVCKCSVMREHRIVYTQKGHCVPYATNTRAHTQSVNKKEKKFRAVIMQISFSSLRQSQLPVLELGRVQTSFCYLKSTISKWKIY